MAVERYILWLPRWKRMLLAALGVMESARYAELDGAWLRLRFGYLMGADVPLAEVRYVRRRERRPPTPAAPAMAAAKGAPFAFMSQGRYLVEVGFRRRLPVRVLLFSLPYESVLLSLKDPDLFVRRLAPLEGT